MREPKKLPTQPKLYVHDLENVRQMPSIGEMKLVLSLFPGIDLFGRGFEAEGFSVVRGPDLIWGQRIEDFHTVPGRFDGVICGSPCQDFSGINRFPTDYSERMLKQAMRVVMEAQPDWFLFENVPACPDVLIPGYTVQRFFLSAKDCGARHVRNRYFQFGSARGLCLLIERRPFNGKTERTPLASEGQRPSREHHGDYWPRRTFADFCELQGLPRDFDLRGWPQSTKYKVVGNGVPIPMARTVARAIKSAKYELASVSLCPCQCGRRISGKQQSATPACRKRLQRRRGPLAGRRKVIEL
jgi:DNA (cytosine-5)-methyltransferase 1